MAKPWIEFVHPDDREATKKAKTSLLSSEKLLEFRNRYICKDGKVKWLSWNAVSYPIDNVFFGVARDVTLEVNKENAISESELEYRSLFSSMTEGVCLHQVIYNDSGKAVDYKILNINPAYEKLTDLKRNEAVGKLASKLYGIIPPPYIEIYSKVAETGQKTSFETYFEPMDKHFSISVFSPSKGRFATVFSDITEQKIAEQSLKRKHEELEVILDSSPIIIFYKDLDGKFVQVNKAFADSMNTAKKKLIGKTVFDLYSHEVAQNMMDDDHVVFKTKRPKLGIVEPYESPKGLKWVRTSKIPTFNDMGEVTGLIGFSEDITEQKSAEDTLRQSKLILENSSDSIIITDLQGNITSWNKGAENIFGYTSIEMVGQSITKVVKPQERVEVASKQLDDVRNDKTFAQTWEGVKKDGSTVWLMLNTKLVKNEKGEPIGMVGFGKDITENKKADEKLTESEAKFRAYVENSPVGVFVTNKEGHYEYVNQGATKLLGYTEQELLNMSVTDIVFAEDMANTASEFVSLKEKGKLCKQYRFKAKGGKEVFVILNAAALPNDKLIAFCENITSLKSAEKEVLKSRNEMIMINEKLHVIGSLTRHDVGNKLMAAKSNMYLLRKQLKDKTDLLKYIDAVDEAFNQSDKIFEFSKIYERIGVEKPIVVDVADMFDEASKLVSHPHVEIVNKAQGLSVVADSMLQRLFYNLIDNSLKHGKHVSTIQLSVKKDKKEEVKLVYEDNGVGVPQQNKLKIFAEGFTTGGSGLGLKLVKRMVEVYRWTIAETGEEGKGARFEITICPP